MTSTKPFVGWASSSSPATPARIESPVPGYHVTTPWGRKPKNNTYWQTRGHHTGDDYGDADGSGRVRDHVVVAVLAGRAVYRGFDKILGRIVLLFADNGETYWYCHLNSVAVPAGDATRGGERVDRQLCDDLGLGPRHEHPWPDAQFEVAEGRETREVLQRLAGRAAIDQRLESRSLHRVEGVAADDPRLQRAATDPPHVRGEQFGVDLRVGHAGGPQPGDGTLEGVAQGDG